MPSNDSQSSFDEWWALYPHHKHRSRKAIARAMWDKITGEGFSTTASNGDGGRVALFNRARPETIVEAAKLYHESIYRDYNDPNPTEYVPAAQVWLNGSRWEDWVEEETEQENNVTRLHG